MDQAIKAINNLKEIQNLIHLVARSYYDAREILVLDLLLYNDYMQDAQLSSSIGIQNKELSKICGRLKSHGMIQILSRLEEVPYSKEYLAHLQQQQAAQASSQQPIPKPKERRKINRTYYYIDYGVAVNSIKYKVYKIQKMLDSQVVESTNSFPFKCTSCGKVYSSLEMMSLELNIEVGMYICEIDYGFLDVDETPDASVGNAQYVKFMTENEKIIDLLKKADDLFIPESTPHLPDPRAMIPTNETGMDKDSEDGQSSIRYKQGTSGLQNNIIVEIEENNQTGALYLDPNAADDLQSYYASLAGNDGEAENTGAIEEQVVISVDNESDEESSSDEEEFEEV